MKTINYTGNSKLISRIVHLLNRKAPLPLDGQGDAEWGTSGQVLTTDGNGNTSWTTPQGGGGDVTDVEVNGTSVVNAQGVAEVSVPTATSDLNNDSGFIDGTDLSTALSDYTPTSGLAAVATSGSYNDLSNKPTIPAAQVNSDWNAVSGVQQILNKPTLATVATSGSYNDLTNKPAIPTVNDGTLTIQQNGTTLGTFTANQSGNTTVNLTGGGGDSVSWTQIQSTGTKIAEIEINGTSQDVFAPESESDETYNMQGTYNNVAYNIIFDRHGKTVSFYASLDGMNTGDSYVVFGLLPSNFKPKTTYAVFVPYSNSAPYAFLGSGSLWITGGGGQVGLYKNSSYPQKSYIFGTYVTA